MASSRPTPARPRPRHRRRAPWAGAGAAVLAVTGLLVPAPPALASGGTATNLAPTTLPAATGGTVTADVTLPTLRFTQVGAGSLHAQALSDGGVVYGWGLNFNGVLGEGTTTTRNLPTPVDTTGVLAGKPITQISVGFYHTLALDADGALYAWGQGTEGQLGIGSATSSTVPAAVDMTAVLPGRTITQIHAGGATSFAIDDEGNVYAWGNNASGLLLDGTTTDSTVPIAVPASMFEGKAITQVSSPMASPVLDNPGQNTFADRYMHALALADDGTVYAWGSGTLGQLGDGSSYGATVPVRVDLAPLGGRTVIEVATIAGASFALADDGTVWSWGSDAYGQLGNGSGLTADQWVPVQVDLTPLGAATITQIRGGDNDLLALASDGSLWQWGNLLTGNIESPAPVVMTGALAGKTVTDLDTGTIAHYALDSDGQAYHWGQTLVAGAHFEPEPIAMPAVTLTGVTVCGTPVTGLSLTGGVTGGVATFTAPPHAPGVCPAVFSFSDGSEAFGQITYVGDPHTVTFEGNGADGGATPAQTATLPTPLTANGFTRTGHTFMEWNTRADGTGTAYADEAAYAFDADVTLFAQWTDDGGTPTPSPAPTPPPTSVPGGTPGPPADSGGDLAATGAAFGWPLIGGAGSALLAGIALLLAARRRKAADQS